MASPIPSSSSIVSSKDEHSRKRARVDKSSSSSSSTRTFNFLVPLDDVNFLKTWVKDLYAYLECDAYKLARVCSKVNKIQKNLGSQLFCAIVSSVGFRRDLSRCQELKIRCLNAVTCRTLKSKEVLEDEESKVKRMLDATKLIYGKSQVVQKLEKDPKLAGQKQNIEENLHTKLRAIDKRMLLQNEILKIIKECVEGTLVDIFKQVHSQALEQRKNPTEEAIRYLSQLAPFVRSQIETLDFSEHVSIERMEAAEFIGILRKCPRILNFTVRRDRATYVNFRGVLRYLRPSISDLKKLDLSAIPGPEEAELCFLLFYSKQLKELRLFDAILSDELLKTLPENLEILSLDWNQLLDEDEDEYYQYGTKIDGNWHKRFDEGLLTKALYKSKDTLKELQITPSAVKAEFLYGAQLFNLRKLDLSQSRGLEETNLAYFFANAKQLVEINLSRTNITGDSFINIKSPVRVLNLSYCSRLNPRILKAFLQMPSAKSLESLRIIGMKVVVDMFEGIDELPNLRELHFSRESFENIEIVQVILSKCPNLNESTKEALIAERDRLSQGESSSSSSDMVD